VQLSKRKWQRDLAARLSSTISKNKMRIIEIFCWTRTAFFETLVTLLGENDKKINAL
jgi:hypothetical protein